MIFDKNILEKINKPYKDLIIEYCEYLELNSKYAHNTIKSYVFDLKSIALYMQKDFENPREGFNNLNNNYLRKLVSDWRNDNVKITTINRKITCFKLFYRWLRDTNYTDNGIIENFSKAKSEKRLPRPLDIKNAFNFIETVEKHSPQKYRKRNLAITYLLYGTGMRIGEMLSITHKIWENHIYGNIKIKGKGSKERIVHLLPVVIEHVNQYINEKTTYNKDDFIITNNKGEQLSPTTIQKNFREFRNIMGLDENFTPHTLRHTFATHLLMNDTDLKSISKLMGHSSIKSTQLYTKINKTKIFNEAKKFKPLI